MPQSYRHSYYVTKILYRFHHVGILYDLALITFTTSTHIHALDNCFSTSEIKLKN